MKHKYLLHSLIFSMAAASSNAAESLSTQEAAGMMIQIRSRCNSYVTNGERFWRGEFKKPEDAPGLILLNKEIQTSVRKARGLESAKESAWQTCLDFIFNNQNSGSYVR